jgi:peptidoglycan/LPS O-acetylase OafA/YrhL
MDTSTSPTVENKIRQVWPHAFWSLLSLSVLYMFLPGFSYASPSPNTGWRGVVFSLVLTLACFWSFVRCPDRRRVVVKVFTLVCLLAALVITGHNVIVFITTPAEP